jgi:hypothetical protein
MITFEEFLKERYDLWKHRSTKLDENLSFEQANHALEELEVAKRIFAEVELIYRKINPIIHISSIEKQFAKQVVAAPPKVHAKTVEAHKLGEFNESE